MIPNLLKSYELANLTLSGLLGTDTIDHLPRYLGFRHLLVDRITPQIITVLTVQLKGFFPGLWHPDTILMGGTPVLLLDLGDDTITTTQNLLLVHTDFSGRKISQFLGLATNVNLVHGELRACDSSRSRGVSDGSPVDPLTTVFIFTRVTSATCDV